MFTIEGARAPHPAFLLKKTPRARSVPPDSATARAKKARVGETEAIATPKPKARAKSIDSGRLAQIAITIFDYFQSLLPPLLPKHSTRLRACTKEWYRKLYHTGYHIPKSDFLDILHSQELDDLRVKHPPGEDTENMKKGLCGVERGNDQLEGYSGK